MAIVHLQSGLLEQGSESESSSGVPSSLTRRALLVYEGEFESMDGVVNVGRDELTTLATNHNGHVEASARLAEGKESMKDYPPVQLDHSTSAKDTVGRMVGKLELSPYKTKDGKDVMAAYGNVKILGEENVVKVMDGRWTHLSVGVDFEKGKFSELTITPFPAAPEASLLKKNLSETKLPGVMKDEALWEKAKRAADEAGADDKYAFAMWWYKEHGGQLSSERTEMSQLARWTVIEGDYGGYSWEIKKGNSLLVIAPDDDRKYFDWMVQTDTDRVAGSARTLDQAKKQAEAAAKKAGVKLSSDTQWTQLASVQYRGSNYIVMYEAPRGYFVRWSDNTTEGPFDSMKEVKRHLIASGAKDANKLSEKTEMAKKKLKKLSEGDKSMDKEKMKKHMMEVHKMSEDEAEDKMAKCTEEEMKKMAAEMDEHEKKMAAEKEEKKEELSEEKDSEKKELAEEKDEEKKKMSEEEEEEKKKLKEEEDKEKKMSAARERIVRLSSDFRKAFEGSQLAAKKGRIVSRLSALKASAKITPAEIKKIDVEKLASHSDETLDLVLKSYEDREPVVMTGALGSIKAHELHDLSKEIKMSRLEAETRKNMSLLKNTVKDKTKRLAESPEEVSIHVDTTPHVHQEMAKCYGDACKLMDEGKLAEAKELLKKYMMKPMSEGRMDMVEHDKQLSALAEESIKMQNKFDELQKLAVSLVG